MKSASRRGPEGAAEAEELVDVREVTTQESIGGAVYPRAAGLDRTSSGDHPITSRAGLAGDPVALPRPPRLPLRGAAGPGVRARRLGPAGPPHRTSWPA